MSKETVPAPLLSSKDVMILASMRYERPRAPRESERRRVNRLCGAGLLERFGKQFRCTEYGEYTVERYIQLGWVKR